MRIEYLEVGKAIKSHGVKGEFEMDCWCDTVEDLKRFSILYTDKKGEKGYKLIKVRPHKSRALVTLCGIDSIDAFESIKGKILYAKRDEYGLDEGQYFIAELEGCTVFDEENPEIVYGVLKEISNYGASDLWHIVKDGNEIPAPCIPGFIGTVDLDAGMVGINPPKGIFTEPVIIDDKGEKN